MSRGRRVNGGGVNGSSREYTYVETGNATVLTVKELFKVGMEPFFSFFFFLYNLIIDVRMEAIWS